MKKFKLSITSHYERYALLNSLPAYIRKLKDRKHMSTDKALINSINEQINAANSVLSNLQDASD